MYVHSQQSIDSFLLFQVKRLVCEWLAWLLRMSRPGHSLSRKILLRKARLRQLEAKTPPSLSLLSNVKDLDNGMAFSSVDFTVYRSVSVDGESDRDRGSTCAGSRPNMANNAGLLAVRNELMAILTELRFITKKMKEDSEKEDETNDWKFAAMVIDRLCFWIFSFYLVLATMCIFISPYVVAKEPMSK